MHLTILYYKFKELVIYLCLKIPKMNISKCYNLLNYFTPDKY